MAGVETGTGLQAGVANSEAGKSGTMIELADALTRAGAPFIEALDRGACAPLLAITNSPYADAIAAMANSPLMDVADAFEQIAALYAPVMKVRRHG